jgi:hypothetical protein
MLRNLSREGRYVGLYGSDLKGLLSPYLFVTRLAIKDHHATYPRGELGRRYGSDPKVLLSPRVVS